MLYFVTKMKQFNSIVLVLNMFLKRLKNVSAKTNIIAYIFRVQANNPIMYGHFCIGFIDFVLADKKVTDFTNMFSRYEFNKNDDILSYDDILNDSELFERGMKSIKQT